MLWRYDGDEWVESGRPLPKKLTLVCWNIWFEAHAREERCRGLAEVLGKLKPDIIGLQEATLKMLRPLLEQEWVRRHYWCSASPTSAASTHGVVLLSRREPTRLAFDPLPGAMGRRLLWADFGDLRIGVVHLESMKKNAMVRREQLDVVFPRLDEAASAILMGDLNFCSCWDDENGQLEPSYRDLWTQLHPEDPGYTGDSVRNPMIRVKEKPVRFDRVLLRSKRWKATSIELIGTEEIAPGVLISDHFGLLAQLQRE